MQTTLLSSRGHHRWAEPTIVTWQQKTRKCRASRDCYLSSLEYLTALVRTLYRLSIQLCRVNLEWLLPWLPIFLLARVYVVCTFTNLKWRAVFTLAASSWKRNVTVWRPSVCLSVCAVDIFTVDSLGDSIRRGQRTFRPYKKADHYTVLVVVCSRTVVWRRSCPRTARRPTFWSVRWTSCDSGWWRCVV